MSTAPKSHREMYLTEVVTDWAVNEQHVVENAGPLLAKPDVLTEWIKQFIRTASPRYEVSRAAWEIRQDLAPNDYDRIDWDKVAAAVRKVAVEMDADGPRAEETVRGTSELAREQS